MKKLNLKEINQVPLDVSEYVYESTGKSQIVLHHTAGNSSGVNTINHWNNDKRGRIATCVTISGKGSSKNTHDGEICQAFSSKYWAYHLGIKPDVFRSRGIKYQRLDKIAIGIEICNWGYLTLKDGKYYNYVNREVSADQVVVLDEPYKRHKYYHAYTDAQIESVRQLLVFWNERYGIPLDYRVDDMWDVSDNALKGVPGIYTHNSYRADKLDIVPQPKMVEMLKNLKKKVEMAKKKDIKVELQLV